jgi:hypothetical protein
VGFRSGEWPLAHRLARRDVNSRAAAQPQDTIDLCDILAIRIEKIRNIDEKDFIERRIDPWERAERSSRKYYLPPRYSRLIHVCRLPQHPIGQVNAKYLPIRGACGNCSQTPSRPKTNFKDAIIPLEVQSIDGESVWFVIGYCHKPTDKRSDHAGRMPQLSAQNMP